MKPHLDQLDERIKLAGENKEARSKAVDQWVEEVRLSLGLPEQIEVQTVPSGTHVRIDPVEEAQELFGKDRVIVVKA